MSNAEPTAGEWIADGPGVYVDRPDGSNIRLGCADIDRAHGITQPSACANARLFAASKDLLAACERVLATMEQCPDLRVRLPLLRAELQIAIAKAKGEA